MNHPGGELVSALRSKALAALFSSWASCGHGMQAVTINHGGGSDWLRVNSDGQPQASSKGINAAIDPSPDRCEGGNRGRPGLPSDQPCGCRWSPRTPFSGLLPQLDPWEAIFSVGQNPDSQPAA
jgi:hypothetical protein